MLAAVHRSHGSAARLAPRHHGSSDATMETVDLLVLGLAAIEATTKTTVDMTQGLLVVRHLGINKARTTAITEEISMDTMTQDMATKTTATTAVAICLLLRLEWVQRIKITATLEAPPHRLLQLTSHHRHHRRAISHHPHHLLSLTLSSLTVCRFLREHI